MAQELSMDELRRRIQELETENGALKAQISAERRTSAAAPPLVSSSQPDSSSQHAASASASSDTATLTLEEYRRYGRQMIVPEFGSLAAQLRLKRASVLVVGAGGLGCPALLYIAASGVGRIGIVDSDTVDASNLHRQVLHTTESLGIPKVESARRYLAKLNPSVAVDTHETMISNDNAFALVSQYDLVLDCTDNPATRYLINDVAVLCGKTIVSGSGLKTEGQLSILNYQAAGGSGNGPCYRCFYPKPPSPNSVTSCKDGGVIGPCIGLVGVAMAVETIKVLTGSYEARGFQPFLSMYSAYPQQSVRVFKMRPRQKTCAVCGDSPSITREAITSGQINYVEFCGKVHSDVLSADQRVSVREYHEATAAAAQQGSARPLLLDVRPKEHFSVVALPGSINVPWDPIIAKADAIDEHIPAGFDKKRDTVYLICRYGNDSQLATEKLLQLGFAHVKDVRGGLNKWSEEIDASFPVY